MIKIRQVDYEITISAKMLGQGKNNKMATLHLINELAMIYREASEKMAEDGYDGCAKLYLEKADAFHEVCEQNGLYKNMKL